MKSEHRHERTDAAHHLFCREKMRVIFIWLVKSYFADQESNDHEGLVSRIHSYFDHDHCKSDTSLQEAKGLAVHGPGSADAIYNALRSWRGSFFVGCDRLAVFSLAGDLPCFFIKMKVLFTALIQDDIIF